MNVYEVYYATKGRIRVTAFKRCEAMDMVLDSEVEIDIDDITVTQIEYIGKATEVGDD